MPNSTINYISSILNSIDYGNQEVVFVSSSVFSTEGDVFTLNFRTLSSNNIVTTQSFNDLVVETSDVHPRKIVTPTDVDGATIILSPSVTAAPTASQNYYTPLRFERFKPEVVTLIKKTFTELTV